MISWIDFHWLNISNSCRYYSEMCTIQWIFDSINYVACSQFPDCWYESPIIWMTWGSTALKIQKTSCIKLWPNRKNVWWPNTIKPCLVTNVLLSSQMVSNMFLQSNFWRCSNFVKQDQTMFQNRKMFGHQTMFPIWTGFKERNNPGPWNEVNWVCLLAVMGVKSMAKTILTRCKKNSFGANKSLEIKAVCLQNVCKSNWSSVLFFWKK